MSLLELSNVYLYLLLVIGLLNTLHISDGMWIGKWFLPL